MHSEFVEMSGLDISYKDYTEVVEPMYMAVENMSKKDFIKFITPSIKALVKSYPKVKTIKKMLVRDNSGYKKTPNGCWYHIEYVELVDVNIATGKYIVAPLVDEDFQKLSDEGRDLDLSTDYDFDYTECIDKRTKKAVKLQRTF